MKGKGTLVLECHSSKNDTKQEEGEFEWVITFISPAVCKLFGDQLEEDVPPPTPVSTTTTTTVAPPPKVPSDKDSSTTTTTVKPTSAGNASATDLALPPVPPARSGMSAWGITGILFLLCSIFVIVGFTLRSPQRRAQVMSLFRRKNVAVSYTRVSEWWRGVQFNISVALFYSEVFPYKNCYLILYILFIQPVNVNLIWFGSALFPQDFDEPYYSI